MNSPSKLLAYFGSDLALRNSARYLSKAKAAGYALLALDSHAMALATRAGVPYMLLDDWVEPAAIANALQVARVCGREWFEPARNEFSVSGICLPEVDRLAMDSFWQDAILSKTLADAVRERRINEFRFFGSLFPHSAVSHLASDVCNRIWRAESLHNHSFSLTLDAFRPSTFLSILRKLRERLRNTVSPELKNLDHQGTPFPRGSVVLVFHCDEDLRFSHLIADLAGRFPGKVAGVMGSHRGEKSAPVFPTWNVPVIFGPHWPITSWLVAFPSSLLPRIDAELERRFLAGYQKSVHASEGRPWERPLKTLKFHFNYYCKYRWPFLYKQVFQYWLRLWESTKPRAVLVTAEPEAVFVLASEAADRLNIPALIIPHACGGGRLVWENLFKGRFLHNSRMQGTHLERSGVSQSALQGCSDLVAKDEYPVHRVKAFSGTGKCRLLALTESTGEGPHLNTYTSPRAQLTALRALADPPLDLKDSVEVAIKVHPFFSDLPMLEAAGPAVMQRLMPPASELESALKETDLVIGVNYRGGAMVHALKMAKPIIYFLTEKDPMLARPDYPYDTFQDGTVIARNPEDFWDLVRKFLSDPSFGRDLSARAATFAQESLHDEEYPDLGALISDS